MAAADPKWTVVALLMWMKGFAKRDKRLSAVSFGTVIGVSPFGSLASACSMVGQAKAHIRSLELGVQVFWLDHSQYPKELSELVGDYTYRVPKDPWGRDYKYSTVRPEVSSQDARFYVWTLGRDGVDGGDGLDKDIGTWTLREDESRPWWQIW